MTRHPTDSLHVLSVLLHYPDEELFNRLDEIASAADHSRPAEIESAIQAFVSELNTLVSSRFRKNIRPSSTSIPQRP